MRSTCVTPTASASRRASNTINSQSHVHSSHTSKSPQHLAGSGASTTTTTATTGQQSSQLLLNVIHQQAFDKNVNQYQRPRHRQQKSWMEDRSRSKRFASLLSAATDRIQLLQNDVEQQPRHRQQKSWMEDRSRSKRFATSLSAATDRIQVLQNEAENLELVMVRKCAEEDDKADIEIDQLSESSSTHKICYWQDGQRMHAAKVHVSSSSLPLAEVTGPTFNYDAFRRMNQTDVQPSTDFFFFFFVRCYRSPKPLIENRCASRS
jgi:hypothetical protein